jgi:hypothetical protein
MVCGGERQGALSQESEKPVRYVQYLGLGFESKVWILKMTLLLCLFCRSLKLPKPIFSEIWTITSANRRSRPCARDKHWYWDCKGVRVGRHGGVRGYNGMGIDG